MRRVGNSLWNGVTSILGEEYSLHMKFEIDGKIYVAKVCIRGTCNVETSGRRRILSGV